MIRDGTQEDDLVVLLGQLPVACVLVRAGDNTVVAANGAFETLLGWSTPQLVGRHFTELSFWASPEQRDSFHQQLFTSGRIQQHEARFQCCNGQTKPCLAYVEQICIGEQFYRLAVFHDLTERSTADQELKQSEAKFAALFMDSPEPYVLFSKRTAQIIEINHRFTEVFGYEPEDVIGKTAADFGLWRYPEKRPAVINKLLREGCLRNEPVDLVTREGRGPGTSQHTILCRGAACTRVCAL